MGSIKDIVKLLAPCLTPLLQILNQLTSILDARNWRSGPTCKPAKHFRHSIGINIYVVLLTTDGDFSSNVSSRRLPDILEVRITCE
jgi:hypothetical protein